jgi:hypothetical protein
MPQVLRQSCDGNSLFCFVLDAVDSAQCRAAPDLPGNAGNAIQSNCRSRSAVVRHSHFDSVRVPGKRHRQARPLIQVLECVVTGRHNGPLQFSGGFGCQAGSIGNKMRETSRSSGQPRVRVNPQLEDFWISGHCACSRGPRRKLPGNLGSNTIRRRRASRFAAPCRLCSTSRTCTDTPACRIAHKPRDLAWQASMAKLYPLLRGPASRDSTPCRHSRISPYASNWLCWAFSSALF